uniref:E3 ubiquitin-protein ligase RNF14-like n=1 Tax=Doryrhamphus excisus TaxID=161450 RepID=UPI0025ADE1C2|nr:E3 ubiquitin-protein ligase RNF14-like [Doryrhamphus excisus]
MDLEEQENELLALQSILGSEEFVRHGQKTAGEVRLSTELPSGFMVALREGDTLKQYEISFLPPLLLTFDFPEDYPSSSPPSFILCCSWLTHKQLGTLGAHLIELYQATGGDVVIFSWVQFLRDDTLRFLNISSLLELYNEHSTPYNSKDRGVQSCHLTDKSVASSHDDCGESSIPESCEFSKDSSVLFSEDETYEGAENDRTTHNQPVSGVSLTPAQSIMAEILIHDAAQTHKVFQSTVFDCAVCFMSYLGSECVQIKECGHVFCQPCLSEFCKLQITEGNVHSVTCAQAGCTAFPTPAQVKSLVGEELFSRYDRLLLQSTLDSMADVMYCPRNTCASPVILDKASNVALCSVCGFAFCVSCKKTYHGTGDCKANGMLKKHQKNDLQQGDADLPQSIEGKTALWHDYTTGSKQRKRLLESRYGRQSLFGPLEDFLSEDWMTSNSKNCPNCFCRIQKNMGCNMMTCTQCRRPFCWACLARLSYQDAYKHFQDNGCNQYQYNL